MPIIFKITICLIFVAANSPVIPPAVNMCVCLLSCRQQSCMHALLAAAVLKLLSYASANKNETKFDYRLITG